MSSEAMQGRDVAASYHAVADAQDVPPGYKRTEVGLVPEDWGVRSLLSCLRDAPSYGINAPAVRFNDSLPAYLRITDISDEGRFRPSPRVSVEKPEARSFYLNVGDLVFARTGASVGKSYLYDPNDGPLVFAGFLIKVTPNPVELRPAFLAYSVQSKRYWDWVATVSARSGQPGINGREYGRLLLPIPSSAEQRAIAEALSDVDGLLGALEALIAKKRAIKQAAMQQLLTGNTRLPGFSGEWREWQLIELVHGKKDLFDDGDWIESEYITTSGIRLIQTGNVGVGHFINTGTKRYISEESYQRLNCKEVRIGDLLICRLADPAGRVCIVPDIGESRMITSVDVTICRALEADPTYLLQLCSTRWWFEQVEYRCGGTTRSRIARGQLAGIQMTLPPLDEQKAIATVLSDMDAAIAALEARRDKTRAIKQGMMQQLLTGRIRLLKPEATA